MLFYLLFFIFTISFIIVTYFIVKFSNNQKEKEKEKEKEIDETWTDENKLILRDFISKNEPKKDIVECIYNKIISIYTYSQFNDFYKEITSYENNPDQSISLTQNTKSFMSNLIDIEKNCSK
jgi:flagellar biosynthesis/type III secretory pathway M-ring protein FliF/YscJ